MKLFHRLAATCCLVILTLSLTSGRYSLLPGGLQLSRGLASTASLTFRDEFDGPGLAKGWAWTDQSGAALLRLDDSALRLATHSSGQDLTAGNTQAPRLTQRVAGDFALETRVRFAPQDVYQAAGLLLWFDERNMVWIGRASENRIAHRYLVDGKFSDPPELLGVTREYTHLRIVRHGDRITTSYSPDGRRWRQTGALEWPGSGDPAPAAAGVFLINNWTEAPAQAWFDYVQIATPPLEPGPAAPAATEVGLHKVVFTVAYVDAPPRYDIDDHQAQLIEGLRLASTWRGYEDPSRPPALTFSTHGGAVLRVHEPPPRRADNGKFDYAAVYQRFDLCAHLRSGEIDEVWIWESGRGDAYEWLTTGGDWSWTWSGNVPHCGRTATTMVFNYQREIDVAYESYAHRVEAALITSYPCEFHTSTWPSPSRPRRCAGVASDRFGFVARPFAGNDQVGACGDVHHPPNVTVSQDYLFGETTPALSICTDWHMDGSSQPSWIGCEAWGCSHGGYMIWWMQNLPGLGNTSRDRDGHPLPNWWESLYR